MDFEPPDTGSFPAYIVTRHDPGSLSHGPDQLRFDELGSGEILIAVSWSSVNYKDAMVTVPGNRVARLSRLVPGVDLAGTVVRSDVPDVRAGQEVVAHGHDLGVAHHGGFAAYARVPAPWVIPLPDAMSARQAMIFGTAGFTAALSIDALEHYGIDAAMGPILVTGASGGVGSMAVAMLAKRGYEVVASTGKASEHAWLVDLGAAEVIGRDDIDDASQRTLASERWAGAVDCVGGSTLASVLRSLRYGGAVAASGLTGGSELHSTVYPFIVRNVGLLGVDSVATTSDRRRQLWTRLSNPEDLRPDNLERFVADQVALPGLSQALSDVLDAKVRGRILVDVASS